MSGIVITMEMVQEAEREYWNAGAKRGVRDVRSALEAALALVPHPPEGGKEAGNHLNGNRPLPWDRDTLGRMVREAWVRWAETQPSPKPSWLVPYEELAEPDKEADRQIGEAIARWTLIGDASRAALTKEER